jgi:hypothetical protein
MSSELYERLSPYIEDFGNGEARKIIHAFESRLLYYKNKNEESKDISKTINRVSTNIKTQLKTNKLVFVLVKEDEVTTTGNDKRVELLLSENYQMIGAYSEPLNKFQFAKDFKQTILEIKQESLAKAF